MNKILIITTIIAEICYLVAAVLFVIYDDFAKASFFMVLYLCCRVAMLRDKIDKLQ